MEKKANDKQPIERIWHEATTTAAEVGYAETVCGYYFSVANCVNKKSCTTFLSAHVFSYAQCATGDFDNFCVKSEKKK